MVVATVDCTEISSFCCEMRLVCSDARVASILNPRMSGWMYEPVRPELNRGLRMLFDAGEFTRELVKFAVQLPPPRHMLLANPLDQPVVLDGVAVWMPCVRFCGRIVLRCWFVAAVRLRW